MSARQEDVSKTEVVRFRCTPEQKKNIKFAAAALGLTVSEFLLGYCLGDKIGQVIMDEFKK